MTFIGQQRHSISRTPLPIAPALAKPGATTYKTGQPKQEILIMAKGNNSQKKEVKKKKKEKPKAAPPTRRGA